MPSSPPVIVPELSRSFKCQEYSQCNGRSSHSLVDDDGIPIQNNDGPKITTESLPCFEVRPSTNGIGMFATKPIGIGDIIIDSEEPIVSTSMSLFPSTALTSGGSGSERFGEDQEEDNIKKIDDQYERYMLDPPFCQTCGTPIGNLRRDHLKAPLHLELPGIEVGDLGLVFTLDDDDATNDDGGEDENHQNSDESLDRICPIRRSPYSQNSAWCSIDCWENRCDMHHWACWSDDEKHIEHTKRPKYAVVNDKSACVQNSAKDTSGAKLRLQTFLEEQENPKIFELAIQAILLVLLLRRNSGQSTSAGSAATLDCDDRYNYFWWEDYGSHPLWWTIGATENHKGRFQRTKEFAGILRDWCNERLALMKKMHPGTSEELFEHKSGSGKRRRINSKCTKDPSTTMELSGESIDNLCSTDNIGALLGMLQCNVMEFSFPSPLQQYMEQAEAFLEEENMELVELPNISKDHGSKPEEEFTSDQHAMKHNALMHGCEWLRKNYRNAPMEDAPSKNGGSFHSPEPVVGSGLYPLLTLANHHCNPNASIEFLRESNCGSMVALRPIKPGEEICITYVPNGEPTCQPPEGRSETGSANGASNTDDVDEDGDYFKHFEPTRTWKWLNHQPDDESDADDEDCDTSLNPESQEDDDDESVAKAEQNNLEDGQEEQEPEQQELFPTDDSAGEGSPEQRALALLEYGFVCKCSRCMDESRYPIAASGMMMANEVKNESI